MWAGGSSDDRQSLRRSSRLEKARLYRRRQIHEMYARSIRDPDGFWGEQAKRLDWIKPFTKVKNASYRPAMSRSNGSRTARSTSPTTASTVISPSAATRPRSSGKATTPRTTRQITYKQLHAEVCRFANVLKAHGVKKGDRVTIYMPMIPEAAIAMLACARIGAVHSVVFGGFSPDSARRPHRGLRIRLYLPPTKACAAAARSRSRPMSMKPARRSAASLPLSS